MKRFAIYYAPNAGAFASATAAWLGWDLAAGAAVAHPAPAGHLPAQTEAARTYGFHGTIKAPFRLADGARAQDLARAVANLAASLPALAMEGLGFAQIEGFLALLPQGEPRALNDLAAEVVRGLDAYRAPLSAAEIARRRPETLTRRQSELLAVFGYPYVLEEFQFHLTLSGRLDPKALALLQTRAEGYLGPHLPRPFVLRDLCLCGEDESGRFHLLGRYPLKT